MSTGLELAYIEPKPGEWYYVLEDWSASRGAFDWRDFATCHGPFKDQDEAQQHMHANNANTGGFFMVEHANFEMDETYEKLISSAHKPRTGFRW